MKRPSKSDSVTREEIDRAMQQFLAKGGAIMRPPARQEPISTEFDDPFLTEGEPFANLESLKIAGHEF
jgi:hypothetical protein